jgi:serine/threonine protein kinase
MSTTEKFEQYEVLKREDGSLFELGRGAMGITYKALDTDLECFVALKIIKSSTIGNNDAELRFFREARAAAQLRHPNIASVFRLGKTADGTHYYAMEFCEGQTLQQLVEESGPIECRRALQFALQVAKALIVAEERHLVHRDLKPSNLIVTRRSDEGEVIKVIDFGLAKTTNPEGTMWSSLGTQGFIGTAHFASPEQIEDKPVDTRSDIYSLGSTLWFMLIGKPPFEGSLARIMSQHLTVAPDFSKLHGVPEEVVALIRRMMEKNAVDRPQSAHELRREILECLETSDAAEEAEELKPDAPAVEPPPPAELAAEEPPPASATPPEEEVWTPTLRDLLRAQSVLSPTETFFIGERLASKLDEDPEPPEGALRIQDVTIHFQDSPGAEAARVRLREHPTAWPEFDLVIHPGDAAAALETYDPSQMMTILPGGDATGDRAQQLARLLYELLGGVAGSRYVPVARLGEAGNAALQRAIAIGLAGYPTLRELIVKLRESSAGAQAPPIPAPTRPATPPSPEPKTPSSVASEALPEAAPEVPQNESNPSEPVPFSVLAAVEPRRESSHEPPPLPLQSPPDSVQLPKKIRRPFPIGKALIALAAAAALVFLFLGVKAIQSHFKNRNVAHDEGTHDEAKEDETKHDQAKHDETPSRARTTIAKPLHFTIYDDLGSDQTAESVWIFLDNQPEPVSTITLTRQHAHGSAVIKIANTGHHVVSLKAESFVLDRYKRNRKIASSGRWEHDFEGGEEYDLTSSPQDNGSSYELHLDSRH